MDTKLRALLDICPCPALAIKDERILAANIHAQNFLGCRETLAPYAFIPEHILENSSESFIASALIKENTCNFQVKDAEGIRFITIVPESSAPLRSAIMSDNLMCEMLSTLFNIGLSIDRLRTATSGWDVRAERYLSLMSQNYYSLRHALTNLNTAMSLKEGSYPFSFKATDLKVLCQELMATVAIMCRDKELNIEFSSPLSELYCFVDSESIERILLNLLSNSIAHTPKGGRISVRLEKSGDTAYISVDDTGCGIAPHIFPKLFTAYERKLSLEEMSHTGGGLGLGIAKGLAEAHEGALLVESRVGKGTSVRLVLPLRSYRFNILEHPPLPYLNSGMRIILTELSGVLSPDCYKKELSE